MVKVSIAGATGYTGFELIRILIRHPQVELVSLTSETYIGQCITDVFPALRGWIKKKLVSLQSDLPASDYIFMALPHATAMERVPEFLERGVKVIDLSADFRLHDSKVFEAWYHTTHLKPDYLKEAVYGLPEIHRNQIKNSRLVANPGCYPTSIILGFAPLFQSDWIDPESIVADSKSGVSGAGRKSSITTQFGECNEALSAYGLGTHRHTPEIEQELSALAGRKLHITFSPHLVPVTRGILSTLYAGLTRPISVENLIDHYKNFYKDEPFIQILEAGQFANTHHVQHSNMCHIGIQMDARTQRVIITIAIDNLVKGASGLAVQNFNLMLGIDETTGLETPGLFP